MEGDLGPGEELRGESRLRLEMLGAGDGTGAGVRETTLTPLLVLVVAGMNSVVWLFAAGTAMRWGWLALHPFVVS